MCVCKRTRKTTEAIVRSLRDYRARYGPPEKRVSELRRLLLSVD